MSTVNDTISRWECPECGRFDVTPAPWDHPLPGGPMMNDCPGVPVERTYVTVEQVERWRSALRDIATRPKVERNPDGVVQAAWTMAAIAEDALGEAADVAVIERS